MGFQMITIKNRVVTYHDSMVPLLTNLNSRIISKEIKNTNILVVPDLKNGTETYFRTLVAQVFGLYLLDIVCELYPDMMIHQKSDPLNCIVNAVRFFSNYLLGKRGQGKGQQMVLYLQNVMNHLIRGSISKDLKSKELLVPS